MTWTVEIGGAGSGDLTEYRDAVPVNFEDRVNTPGTFKVSVAQLNGNPEPSRRDLVRLVWDKGQSSEQVHFEGYIQRKRQIQSSNAFELTGWSLDNLLWTAGAGGVRDCKNTTPFSIIQGSGSPSNLLTNAQGNNVSIGSTTLQYASDGTVANQIDSTNTGGFGTSGGTLDNGDFRAASDKLLANIQRLCLQGRFDTSDPGLEYHAFLVDGTGSGSPTEPRFALAKRRERASSYTAESFTIDQDFAPAKRGAEGLTAADAVKVIGAGSGQTGRAEGSVQGTGDIEKVIADKTVINSTNADNMASRLTGLLDPSTEVVTGWHYQHDTDTRAGDDVVIKEDGVSDTTLRCFSRIYDYRRKGFKLVAGRPQEAPESSLYNLERLTQGHGQGAQIMDSAAVDSSQPSSSTKTISDGSSASITLNFNDQVFDVDYHEALTLFYQVTPPSDSGEVGIMVQLGNTEVYELEFSSTTEVMKETVYLPRAFAAANVSGEQSSATLQVTNKTGSSGDFTLQLHGWVQA